MRAVLGIDTSCYTTSCALVTPEGEILSSSRRLLTVEDGARGLMQSQGLFQHVKNLPQMVQNVMADVSDAEICAVCASTRPRPAEDSYMPVFRAGESQARAAASLLRVPFYPASHQEGHVRAAMVDAGIDETKPFLALHLSGGTTEILLSEEGKLTLLGGSLDLHAGQLVDRTGVRLHMPFPAGPSLEKLAMEGKAQGLIGVSIKGVSCNMAGAENKVTRWIEGGDMPKAQIAAEVLDCPLDNVTVLGADTDSSPYDSGSYASSTTYVTGKAVEQCAEQLKQKICQVGAGLLGLDERAVVFAGDAVTSEDGTQRATLAQIAAASQCGSNTALEAVVTHSSEISPPPFMVGAAEVEVDLETGEAQVIRYEAAVDCGTPVNPNLARVQAEGGILQGIGMALTENITYDRRGMPAENSLMQYKIPTRQDIGHISVEFEASYEETGPYGAKSIGEVVINTPLPAIADAVYNATGKRFRELPITPEQIAMAAK